ncbi:MAG: APC family permease [Bacilli bacterium]
MAKKKKFKRILGRTDILVLAFGAMIGWGWVVQSGEWILGAGTFGAMIAFALGGIMIYFIALTYAELTSAMPQNGGEHVFSKRALGNKASFICTWAIIFGYITVVMFEAVALPTILEFLFPNFSRGFMYTIAGYDVNFTWVLVGVLGSVVVTIINYLGIKVAANLQTVLVVLLASVGIALASKSALSGDISNIQPTLTDGFGGILKILVLTPFFFVGFDVIPQAAGEINIPFKKVGRVMLASIFFAVAWNVIIIWAVSYAMSSTQIAQANLTTAEAMKIVFGNSQVAANILIIGGLAGIVSSWNSFLMAGSRAIQAMADSKMLPSFFAKVDKKHNTPANAIFFIGLISSLAPFLGKEALLWIANAGGLSVVFAYFIVSLSFLALRKNEPNMVRKYKVKNGKLVGIIAVIMSGIVFSLYLIPSLPSFLGFQEWLIVGSWIILGVGMYVHCEVWKLDKKKFAKVQNRKAYAVKEGLV